LDRELQTGVDPPLALALVGVTVGCGLLLLLGTRISIGNSSLSNEKFSHWIAVICKENLISIINMKLRFVCIPMLFKSRNRVQEKLKI
jgi:hypothetical protein